MPKTTDEGSDVSSSTDNIRDVDQCDRRLSRAARAILVEKMLPILQHYYHHQKENETIENASVSTGTGTGTGTGTTASNNRVQTPLSSLGKRERIEYYQKSVQSLMENPQRCLLNPDRDIYWHEEHLHRITTSSLYRLKRSPFYSSSNNLQHLHVCGICGKKFLSKFYLDQHVEAKHESSIGDSAVGAGDSDGHYNNGTLSNQIHGICPADDLCERLGGRNVCEKKALEDEPFYASGIHDESSMYSQLVKRQFQKLAHDKPCSITREKQERDFQDCRDMFQTCFGSNEDLVQDLSSFVCETQSCHHQLHSIFGSLQVFSIHSGREYWNSHHDEINSVGIMLILFLICMGIYYWNTIYKITQRKLRRRKKKKAFFDVTRVKKFD